MKRKAMKYLMRRGNKKRCPLRRDDVHLISAKQKLKIHSQPNPSSLTTYVNNIEAVDIIPEDAQLDQVNDNNDVKTTFYAKRNFFPEQLRNYIDTLNTLFARQNEILENGSFNGHLYKREFIPKPNLDELLPRELMSYPGDLQGSEFGKTRANTAGKFYGSATAEYLKYGANKNGTPAESRRNVVVGMAQVKGRRLSTKTGKHKKPKTKKGAGDATAKTGKSDKGKSKKGKLDEDAVPQEKKPSELDLDNLSSGITAIPNETLMSKIISFRAEPAKPEIYCFRPRIQDEKYYYSPEVIAAEFFIDGTGYIQYPNREVAVSITSGRVGKKLVVYSESKVDEFGNFRPSVPLAIFDNYGNGVIYDIFGNIRLNYDQGDGVLYDTPSKLPVHWKWENSHFLIQRRHDLEFVDEDEPDNDVPETPPLEEIEEVDESKGKTARKRTLTGTKSKKTKGGTTMAKTKGETTVGKSKRKATQKSKKGETKGGDKGTAKKKGAKGKTKNGDKDSAKSGKGTGKKGDKDTAKSLKGTKAGEYDPHTPAGAKWAKIRAILEYKKHVSDKPKRVLPPISEPPKVLIPITQFKPLAMKITDHVGLRILHQQHIHVDFTCYPIHFSLYVGTRVYPEFLERIDKISRDPNDQRKIPCYFEFLNKRTMSLYDLFKKRTEMVEVGRKERVRKRMKQAYRMGWYIHKKKKVLTDLKAQK